MNVYKREPYVDRLFRILDEAGYSPTEVLTITPVELFEVPGITVPNIRTILHLQQVVLNCTWVRDYRYDCDCDDDDGDGDLDDYLDELYNYQNRSRSKNRDESKCPGNHL